MVPSVVEGFRRLGLFYTITSPLLCSPSRLPQGEAKGKNLYSSQRGPINTYVLSAFTERRRGARALVESCRAENLACRGHSRGLTIATKVLARVGLCPEVSRIDIPPGYMTGSLEDTPSVGPASSGRYPHRMLLS